VKSTVGPDDVTIRQEEIKRSWVGRPNRAKSYGSVLHAILRVELAGGWSWRQLGEPASFFDANGHIDRVTGTYSRWIDASHTEPGHCEPAAAKF
jgi:hypothetical protein